MGIARNTYGNAERSISCRHFSKFIVDFVGFINETMMAEDIQKHSVHTLVFRSLKRTHDMFLSEEGVFPPLDSKAEAAWKASKARATYGPIVNLVKKQQEQARKTGLPAGSGDEVLAIKNNLDTDPASQSLALTPAVSASKSFQAPQVRILQQSEFRAMPEDHPAAVLKVWPHGKLLRCPNPSGIPRGNSPALFPVTPAGSVAWP